MSWARPATPGPPTRFMSSHPSRPFPSLPVPVVTRIPPVFRSSVFVSRLSAAALGLAFAWTPLAGAPSAGFAQAAEDAGAESAAEAVSDPAFVYEDRVLGAADAPVEMVEVSSLLCGHCAHFHKDTLPLLKKEYIETGKVRLVFRDHSLGHPLAMAAAMVARCAPETTFFPLLDSLFANQKAWAGAENSLEALKGYAGLAGLDGAAIAACLDSEAVFEGIRAGEAWAQEHGVDSTPSFLIDGDPVVLGAQPIEAFRAVLDPLIAERTE